MASQVDWKEFFLYNLGGLHVYSVKYFKDFLKYQICMSQEYVLSHLKPVTTIKSRTRTFHWFMVNHCSSCAFYPTETDVSSFLQPLSVVHNTIRFASPLSCMCNLRDSIFFVFRRLPLLCPIHLSSTAHFLQNTLMANVWKGKPLIFIVLPCHSPSPNVAFPLSHSPSLLYFVVTMYISLSA